MNKLKIYLSQPMMGKTKEQILEEREPYMKMYGGDDCEFINNVFDIDVNKDPLYYLAKSIELLVDADIVYLLPGWDKARGCKIEYNIALKYGKYIKEA